MNLTLEELQSIKEEDMSFIKWITDLCLAWRNEWGVRYPKEYNQTHQYCEREMQHFKNFWENLSFFPPNMTFADPDLYLEKEDAKLRVQRYVADTLRVVPQNKRDSKEWYQ
jgi:hypothetical protein